MATDSWSALRDATDATAFAAAWPGVLIERTGARAGIVTIGPPDTGPFRVRAVTPRDAAGLKTRAQALDAAVAERKPVVKREMGRGMAPGVAVAAPLLRAGALHGVALLSLETRADTDLASVTREIEWAVPMLLAGPRDRPASASLDAASTALDILASTLDHKRARAACVAAASDVAERLGCERASIGFRKRRTTKVAAVSKAGRFEKRAGMMHRLADAMDEAIDQNATVLLPQDTTDPLTVTAAHAALQEVGRERAIATLPLRYDDRIVGALTLERPASAPFDPPTVQLAEVVAALLGPILTEKRLNDRALPIKVAHGFWGGVRWLLGARDAGKRLALLAFGLAVVFLWQQEGLFRLDAAARIEGETRRVIAAPIDGYVRSASARAGDIVEEGAEMAQLDDREIRLELTRWLTVRAQRQREYETALSSRNRAEIGITDSRISQAEAEIALLEERLARTTLAAPFAGVVLSGDLDQAVGAPVARGDVLFEIAPLDAYRVILSVDEADLATVAPGMGGSIVLTALPGQTFPLEVGRVTSVAGVEDGRNVFRVEAELTGLPGNLRPGMRGVAKIDVGERPLIEIWTRDLVSWLRLAIWRWTP